MGAEVVCHLVVPPTRYCHRSMRVRSPWRIVWCVGLRWGSIHICSMWIDKCTRHMHEKSECIIPLASVGALWTDSLVFCLESAAAVFLEGLLTLLSTVSSQGATRGILRAWMALLSERHSCSDASAGLQWRFKVVRLVDGSFAFLSICKLLVCLEDNRHAYIHAGISRGVDNVGTNLATCFCHDPWLSHYVYIRMYLWT